MVTTKEIIQYLNNFRRLFSNFLKNGVGIQITTYPFDKGYVVIVELGLGIKTKEEMRAQSPNLQTALKRTNLFDTQNIPQEMLETYIILSQNKIILIKTDDEKQWSDEAVVADMKNIMKQIVENRRNRINGKKD